MGPMVSFGLIFGKYHKSLSPVIFKIRPFGKMWIELFSKISIFASFRNSFIKAGDGEA